MALPQRQHAATTRVTVKPARGRKASRVEVAHPTTTTNRKNVDADDRFIPSMDITNRISVHQGFTSPTNQSDQTYKTVETPLF
jgi:hypothetical protein